MTDRLSERGAKTFVFDLDGVVYLAGTAVPGARETLQHLDGLGHQILFATNNSARSADKVAAAIRERVGFDPEPGSIVTSGAAAANLLAGDGETCLVLGSTDLEHTLRTAGIAVTSDPLEASTLVVGLDRRLSYERLTAAVVAVDNGARFIATNDDPTFPTPTGKHPGGGAIVAAVERATGRRAVVCGKPHTPMRSIVERKIVNDEIWMVGDRIDTDLALAAAAGWGKILVLTGVTSEEDEVPAEFAPDHTIRSIAELPALVTRESSRREG